MRCLKKEIIKKNKKKGGGGKDRGKRILQDKNVLLQKKP